jgi:hypothetical protein
MIAAAEADPTAQVALVVSIVGLVLAIAGLLWQVGQYVLLGARIRVELQPGRVDHSVFHTSNNLGGWAPDVLEQSYPAGQVEVARLVVVNRGRSPVTVENLSVNFRSEERSSTHRSGEVRGKAVPQFSSTIEQIVRIEAGDIAFVVFDLWSIVEVARQDLAGPLVLRGSARRVGRKATLSRKRHAWVIQPASLGLLADASTSGLARAYHELWGYIVRDGRDQAKATAAWFELRKALRVPSGAIDAEDARTSIWTDVDAVVRSVLGPESNWEAAEVVCRAYFSGPDIEANLSQLDRPQA